MNIRLTDGYLKISLFEPIIVSFLQFILNKFFYQEIALKSVRIKLIRKILSIDLKELSKPLILIFSEKRVDIVNNHTIPADFTIKTTLLTLVSIENKQQISALINDGRIVITGDIQVGQNWFALLDAILWDPAHYMSPYVGNIIAESINRLVKNILIKINRLSNKEKNFL
ncbi:MAG: SCP2 domain-containing protein [Arsenophonus sp.]